tara:strand:+ start:4306 stop:5193 length:888 start_codon:yes stop_codon:yes gene_type:complete
MAKQTVNVGSTANDGTGDKLRDAFVKVNANFTELYTDDAGDVNSVTAGTGISVNQTTGAVVVTNSDPDQTVSLTGVDIAVSGTYPSFTLTNSAPNANHTGDVTGATALTIANGVVGASKLDVTGNGTAGQALLSDGDGTFSWGAAGAAYTAGTGITLTGTEFSIGQAVATNSDIQFNSLGVGTAAPTTAGLIRATNDVVAYYSSDKRLKDNIKPIEGALNKVCKLGGYEFDWNSKQDVYEGHDIGVIAQEVEAVFPELVTDRESGFKAVKYEKLIPALIEAIKELKAEVESLKSK